MEKVMEFGFENCVGTLQRGYEPFLEGLRIDILCTLLYYICFLKVLDGIIGL